jgi:hypothetical protein
MHCGAVHRASVPLTTARSRRQVRSLIASPPHCEFRIRTAETIAVACVICDAVHNPRCRIGVIVGCHEGGTDVSYRTEIVDPPAHATTAAVVFSSRQ